MQQKIYLLPCCSYSVPNLGLVGPGTSANHHLTMYRREQSSECPVPTVRFTAANSNFDASGDFSNRRLSMTSCCFNGRPILSSLQSWTVPHILTTTKRGHYWKRRLAHPLPKIQLAMILLLQVCEARAHHKSVNIPLYQSGKALFANPDRLLLI